MSNGVIFGVAIKRLALLVAVGWLASGTARAAVSPDVLFSTSYTVGFNSIHWSTCGSKTTSVGCTGGTLSIAGPCAIMEGAPTITGGIASRKVYVIETNSMTFPNAVLVIYQHNQFVDRRNIDAKMVLLKRVDLGLKSGLTTKCSMGANATTLFIGTSQSSFGVKVDKTTLAISQFTNGTPARPVTSIFSDPSGYVIVNFGREPETSFITFEPPGGTGGGDGGGTQFNLNENNAVILR